MNKNKLALSGVVATALLLVVAVASIVSFQGWYNTYSSQLLNDVDEKSSNQIAQTGIETLNGNKLYFKNGENTNISIEQIKIDNINCNVTGDFEPGVSTIDVSACVSNITTQTPEIVVFTNDNIISKNVFVENSNALNTTSFESPSVNLTLIGNLTWNRTINDSLYNPRVLITDSNNNIILGGHADIDGPDDFYLGKFDSNGDEIWNITKFNGSSLYVNGVDVDSQDNIYVIYANYSASQVYIEKYSPSGNSLWRSTIFNDTSGTPYADDLHINKNDEIIASLSDTNSNDIHFYKYDTSGNKIWNSNITQTYGLGKLSEFDVDANDNIIIAFSGSSSNFNFYTYAFNSNGNPLWNASYDNSGEYESISDVCSDSLGNTYVVGKSGGTFRNVRIIKYDSNGNEISNQRLGYTLSGSISNHCAIFSNNDLLIYDINSANTQAHFIRFNQSFSTLWEDSFTLSEEFSGRTDVTIDNQDNIVFALRSSWSGSGVSFLSKID